MSTRLKTLRLGPAYGGVNKHLAEHVIPDNKATVTDNFVLRSKGLTTVNGWELFTSQVITDGEATPGLVLIYRIEQFYRNDGSSYLLAFTSEGLYYFDEIATNLWLPISPGVKSSTTVDADSNSGTNVLNVAATTGYTVGDSIMIGEGTAREEEAFISVITVGVSFTLVANLTFTHTAVQADAVRRTYAVAYVDVNSAAAQAVLSVTETTQFTVGESVAIGLGTVRAEIKIIQSISAGVSLTFTTNLTYAHDAADADKVYRIKDLSFVGDIDQIDVDDNNDVFYFTDGINSIQRIATITNPLFHEDLPGLTTGDSVQGIGVLTESIKAKYIRSFEGFLILGNLTEQGAAAPNKIRWCQIDEFEIWENETDGTGQAGFFSFNKPDWVMGLHQLKRELMIYRETRIEAMSYLGLPNIFGFRNAQTDGGLVSPRGIVDFGDTHIYVSQDNIYEFNGISKNPIGDAIKDDFYEQCHPAQLSNIALYFLKEVDELRLCFSTTDSKLHDKAYTYNVLFKEWAGPVDMDSTGYGYYREQDDTIWDNMVGTWDSIPTTAWDSRIFTSNAPLYLVGNDDGVVFKLDNVATKNGSTISKRYESKRFDMGNAQLLKSVQRIRVGLDVSGSPAVNVYLGVYFSEYDTVTWKGPYALTATAGYIPYVYMDEYGRYFKVRVDTDANTTIHDIEAHWYPRAEI